MVDLLKGRWPKTQPLPEEITEYFLAEKFGWTLHYIRNGMSPRDVQVTVQLLNLHQRFIAGDLDSTAKKEKS